MKSGKDCEFIIYIAANNFNEVMATIEFSSKLSTSNIQSITRVLDNLLIDIDTLKMFKSL